MELHQDQKSHDILILRYRTALNKSLQNDIKKGDPVKLTWKSGVNSSVFIGFVHSIEGDAAAGSHYTKVVCTNNSAILKKTDRKIFKNLTADGIVREICTNLAFNLTPITSNDPYVHKNIPQAGQSYWQLLRQLAEKTGFALRAENSQIMFKDRDQLLHEKIPTAPVFIHIDNVPRGATSMQTLIKFNVLNTVVSPELNHGDSGLVVHDSSGNKHSFNPGGFINNGAAPTSDISPPTYWNNTYGVVDATTIDGV
ncbi:MAG: XkdQ/YqbQ family protein [Fluviibacter sp.]